MCKFLIRLWNIVLSPHGLDQGCFSDAYIPFYSFFLTKWAPDGGELTNKTKRLDGPVDVDFFNLYHCFMNCYKNLSAGKLMCNNMF